MDQFHLGSPGSYNCACWLTGFAVTDYMHQNHNYLCELQKCLHCYDTTAVKGTVDFQLADNLTFSFLFPVSI